MTDDISKAWSGMSTKEYKQYKGLKKEGLRDNMTNIELILNTLAEASTTEISKVENPDGFRQSRDVARRGVTRKYVAKFTDVNGAEVQAVAAWSISVPDGVSVIKGGNEVTVEVPLDEALVGETITITLTDSEGLFGTSEKKVQVITVG